MQGLLSVITHTFERKVTDLHTCLSTLNRFTQLGRPDTVLVAWHRLGSEVPFKKGFAQQSPAPLIERRNKSKLPDVHHQNTPYSLERTE